MMSLKKIAAPDFPPAVIRGAAFVLVLGAAAFVMFFRLGTETLLVDELIYRRAGQEYIHGQFAYNFEHPFLAKYFYGASQVLFGSDAAGVRLPAACAGLAIGVVLFLLSWRVVGYWVGLLTLALWSLLPHGIVDGLGVNTIKIERSALLEPIAGLFMVLALAAGWYWAKTGRWYWAVLTGVASGLATASKLTGIMVLAGLTLVVIGSRRSWQVLAQAATVGAVCLLTAFATYLPAGSKTPEAIRYMIEFQAKHAAAGHVVFVAGQVTARPPWWSLLWWQWLNYGTLVTAALVLAVIACLWANPQRLFTVYVLTAGLTPLVVLSFASDVKLVHYYYAWQPQLTLLAAVGISRLATMRTMWHRLAAVALVIPLAWSATTTIARVATLEPQDYRAAANLLRSHNATAGQVAVFGQIGIAKIYLPGVKVVSPPKDQSQVTAIIADPTTIRRYSKKARENYQTYIASAPATTVHFKVDRLDVYVRPLAQQTN